MFPAWQVVLIVFAYLLVLFLVAYYAERREAQKRSIVSNPYVYALSMAVYCTSWTFYGSVGKAANSGLDFLTIYIGPTLMVSIWWIVMRKVVRIAREYRITTISDFLGSRYGNSLLVSALVTVIAVVGIAPYMGLQIKAIINTFTICTGHIEGGQFTGWIITFILGIFAVIFGARHLDSSERHSGLVFAIAFESVIKLAAFLMVGVFVAYELFNGFGDIFSRASASEFSHLLRIGDGSSVTYANWFSLTFLSMMAIMFLPRQFHVAVVENSNEAHLAKARWLFPLYLLLINLFVLPVALGGLLTGISPAMADNYVLILPLLYDRSFLTIVAFIGGFSAATAMLIVESIALSTMVMNSLVIPAIYRFSDRSFFSLMVLNAKRLAIIASVFSGYMFAVVFGEFYTLVDMGLKSFEAVALFAPPFFGALYWKTGNRKGAIAGLAGGFGVWLYTLFLPAMHKAGLFAGSPVMSDLYSSRLFNPTALFGVTGLDRWTHSLLWSFSVNCLLYAGVSLFTRQNDDETRQAMAFVDMQAPERPHAPGAARPLGGDGIEELLCQYIGNREGRRAYGKILREKGINPRGMSRAELRELRSEAEKILSGAIGSSIATLILRDSLVVTEDERREVADSIKTMADSLRYSRQELASANRQLVFLKEFSENIIESLPLGIVTIDGDGCITYWNRYMEDLTGIAKSRANAAPVQTLMGDMHQCFLGDEINSGEYLCNRRFSGEGHKEQTIKIYASPFKGLDKGYVFVLEDVTEKKRLEMELAQSSKHASLGRLTAGVSHEIGNPLASISSLVQELASLDLRSDADLKFTKDSLSVINGHLARIARIVRSLGDFARLSSPDRITCGLNEILDRTMALVRYDKKARNIAIAVEMDDGMPVRANPDQIQQVFLNIMLNALDAMPEGGELSVSAKSAGGWVETRISDTGTGIDPSVIDRIFDPFFTTKPLGKGTGLGLSICYGIIKDHGGTITAGNNRLKGSTFIIRLPAADI